MLMSLLFSNFENVSTEDLINYAILQYNDGKYYEATMCIVEAKQREPYNPKMNYYNALIKIVNKNYTSAIEDLFRVLEVKKEDFDALFALGKSYYLMNNISEAVKFYERAAKAKPDNPETYFNIAVCYEMLNNTASAEENYELYYEKKPEDQLALFNLGKIYYKQNKAVISNLFLEKSLILKPSDGPALYLIALNYENLKEEKKVIEYLKKALSTAPDDFEILSKLGTYCLDEKQYTDAIIYLSKCTQLHKDALNESFNLGLSYYHTLDYEKALNNFKYYNSNVTDNADGLYMAGLCLVKLNRIAESDLLIKESAKKNNVDAQNYLKNNGITW